MSPGIAGQRNGGGGGPVLGLEAPSGLAASPGAEAPSGPGAARLRQWAEAYARYAALVREQVEALRRDDLSRLHALAAERDGLQERIRSWGAFPPLVEELGVEGRRVLEEVTAHLREALAQDEVLRGLLVEVRARVAKELQALPLRQESARRYLLEAASGPALVGPGKLDRRF